MPKSKRIIVMPVTKTAKRALRSSKRKEVMNKKTMKNLEIALRLAKKNRSENNILKAISQADRAAKKSVIHKNKAARIKSTLSKLLPGKSKVKQKSNKKIPAQSKPAGKTSKKKSQKK